MVPFGGCLEKFICILSTLLKSVKGIPLSKPQNRNFLDFYKFLFFKQIWPQHHCSDSSAGCSAAFHILKIVKIRMETLSGQILTT